MPNEHQDETAEIVVVIPIRKHREALQLLDEMQRPNERVTIGELYSSLVIQGIRMRRFRAWRAKVKLRRAASLI